MADDNHIHVVKKNTGFIAGIFRRLDRLGDLWITKGKLAEKNFLRPVSCGASYFEQAISDFNRLKSYPSAPDRLPGANQPPVAREGEQTATAEAGVSAKAKQQSAVPSLPICPAPAAYKQEVGELIEQMQQDFAAGHLTWDQLYGLQLMLLPMLPEDELRARQAILRDAYYQRAPKHQIAVYEKSGPPGLGKTEPYPAALADALHLQREISDIDTYRPHQELKRNTITYELFLSLIVVLFFEMVTGGIVWAVGVYHANQAGQPSSTATFPFIIIVMMLGALGAAVSSQRRLQESFDDDGSILNTTRYVGSGVGVKLGPFQGSVFAALLLFILYSGLPTAFTATLLPDVNKVPEETATASPTPTPVAAASSTSTTVDASPRVAEAKTNAATTTAPSPSETSISRTSKSKANEQPASDRFRRRGAHISRAILFLFGPEDTIEYAKLLVYAFLAGFAERLVPDTLDRLTRSKN
jgi:hypothetical protein